ncbi:MAG: hypothetical protein GY771_08905 [bacterium]|nr:hypothetical protein [bacterium]
MTPRVNVEVDNVEVCRGEILTVWLNPNRDRQCENRQQVELRVQHDGTLEIFLHAKQGEVLVDDFEYWKPARGNE